MKLSVKEIITIKKALEHVRKDNESIMEYYDEDTEESKNILEELITIKKTLDKIENIEI